MELSKANTTGGTYCIQERKGAMRARWTHFLRMTNHSCSIHFTIAADMMSPLAVLCGRKFEIILPSPSSPIFEAYTQPIKAQQNYLLFHFQSLSFSRENAVEGIGSAPWMDPSFIPFTPLPFLLLVLLSRLSIVLLTAAKLWENFSLLLLLRNFFLVQHG